MGRAGILATGGAGDVGRHVLRQLGAAGERVLTLDNLSRGRRAVVTTGTLVVGGARDVELVRRVLPEQRIDTLMHLAAFTDVPESGAAPLSYFRNLAATTRALLECCVAAAVPYFVFSSTAAVYRKVAGGLAADDTETAPINSYGASKLRGKQLLSAASARAPLLTQVAVEHAVGRRALVSNSATDYPTPDGTGVRDSIHIEDLATAPLKALAHLRSGGASTTLNCGYGHSHSVREEPRRAGDPARIVARAEHARSVLAWTPRYGDLDRFVRDALNWERSTLIRSAA